MRWDAARARSRETPRKYVECGPVGRKHGLEVTRDDGDVPTCEHCGYQACSCTFSQQLEFVGGGEMLPMRVSETSNKFNFPVRPGFEHGQTSGLPEGSFELVSPVGKVKLVVSENIPLNGPGYMFTYEGIKKL